MIKVWGHSIANACHRGYDPAQDKKVLGTFFGAENLLKYFPQFIFEGPFCTFWSLFPHYWPKASFLLFGQSATWIIHHISEHNMSTAKRLIYFSIYFLELQNPHYTVLYFPFKKSDNKNCNNSSSKNNNGNSSNNNNNSISNSNLKKCLVAPWKLRLRLRVHSIN